MLTTHTSRTRTRHRTRLAAVIMSVTLIAMVGSTRAATISVEDSGSYKNTSGLVTHTVAVTAGAADIKKLVLSLHTETSASFSSIQFNGVDMTKISGTGTGDPTHHVSGIWELDNPALSSGNIVVTFSAASQLGLAFTALDSSDGKNIAVGSVDRQSGSSINFAVPNDDSFVFVAGGGNGGSRNMSAQSPLTRLTIDRMDSMAADAGYQNGVGISGSPHTYSFSTTASSPVIAAASFYVIPEPASLGLFMLGGLALVTRRRRK